MLTAAVRVERETRGHRLFLHDWQVDQTWPLAHSVSRRNHIRRAVVGTEGGVSRLQVRSLQRRVQNLAGFQPCCCWCCGWWQKDEDRVLTRKTRKRDKEKRKGVKALGVVVLIRLGVFPPKPSFVEFKKIKILWYTVRGKNWAEEKSMKRNQWGGFKWTHKLQWLSRSGKSSTARIGTEQWLHFHLVSILLYVN